MIGVKVSTAARMMITIEKFGDGETTNSANTTMFQQTGKPLKP